MSNQILLNQIPPKQIPINPRFLNLESMQIYLGEIGASKARAFLREIGAERRVGRRCVYDRLVVDAYFDKQQLPFEDTEESEA